jgi:hypothetical protein
MITIHRHAYTLARSDGFQLYAQTAWTFEPVLASETTGSTSGITHRRTGSEPVEVKIPVVCMVHRGRLIVPWDNIGLPADLVASAAAAERHGFAWAK